MTGKSGRRCLISRSRLSPSMPGMLMSDRMTISSGRTPFDNLSRASSPEAAKCRTYVPWRASRRKRWRNMSATSGSSSTTRMLKVMPSSCHCGLPGTRQADREFGEFAGFAVDCNRAAVLLRDDIIADREPEPGALAGRLGRKERLKQPVPDFGRDTGAVVAHPGLDRLAQITGRHLEGRAIAGLAIVACALVGGVEAVADEVQEHA